MTATAFDIPYCLKSSEFFEVASFAELAVQQTSPIRQLDTGRRSSSRQLHRQYFSMHLSVCAWLPISTAAWPMLAHMPALQLWFEIEEAWLSSIHTERLSTACKTANASTVDIYGSTAVALLHPLILLQSDWSAGVQKMYTRIPLLVHASRHIEFSSVITNILVSP